MICIGRRFWATRRTRGRPLPSGQVTVKQAWIFTTILCSIGFGVLVLLPRGAQYVALGSIPLVAAYPFMKRITWWPQLWLGLTFNWGALVGYTAMAGHLAMPAYLLYATGIVWTLGYDTIYALQDIEDDALAGVKSSARASGQYVILFIAGCYLVMIALLSVILFWNVAEFHAYQLLYSLPAPIYAVFKAFGLRPVNAQKALQLFRDNAFLGFIVFMEICSKQLH